MIQQENKDIERKAGVKLHGHEAKSIENFSLGSTIENLG